MHDDTTIENVKSIRAQNELMARMQGRSVESRLAPCTIDKDPAKVASYLDSKMKNSKSKVYKSKPKVSPPPLLPPRTRHMHHHQLSCGTGGTEPLSLTRATHSLTHSCTQRVLAVRGRSLAPSTPRSPALIRKCTRA